jgi:hypothetical protein
MNPPKPVPQVTAHLAAISHCLLTEAIMHSDNSEQEIDMENRIELSLRDLEIVNGGAASTVNMMGDTWTCDGHGTCTRTEKEDTWVNRAINWVKAHV